MAESWEDSSPISTIETEDDDDDEDEIRTTDCMIIEWMSNEEENVGRTKDFLKLIDKRTHNPRFCSVVYKKDYETHESWGSSGSGSNEEDLMTKDFLKLIDGISNSVEEDVRTKDYLKLIDRRRNEGEDQESITRAESGENLGYESKENDTRTFDYLKLIDRRWK